MRIHPDRVREPVKTASEAGAFVEKAAGAAQPSTSTLGRVGAAATAVKLGARLVPAAWRLLKRYPVASALGAAGLIWAVYLMRATRTSARL